MSEHLFGVSLPARSARCCRALSNAWLLAHHPRKQRQRIRGRNGVPVLPAWALLVVHDTHIRCSRENIFCARVCARVWMYECVQRIKSPAPREHSAGKSPAHMGAGRTAEHPLEVAGLQAGEDDDDEIPGPYSKYAGNGDRKLPRTDSCGVEVSTRPSPHSFLPPAQVKQTLCVDYRLTIGFLNE